MEIRCAARKSNLQVAVFTLARLIPSIFWENFSRQCCRNHHLHRLLALVAASILDGHDNVFGDINFVLVVGSSCCRVLSNNQICLIRTVVAGDSSYQTGHIRDGVLTASGRSGSLICDGTIDDRRCVILHGDRLYRVADAHVALSIHHAPCALDGIGTCAVAFGGNNLIVMGHYNILFRRAGVLNIGRRASSASRGIGLAVVILVHGNILWSVIGRFLGILNLQPTVRHLEVDIGEVVVGVRELVRGEAHRMGADRGSSHAGIAREGEVVPGVERIADNHIISRNSIGLTIVTFFSVGVTGDGDSNSGKSGDRELGRHVHHAVVALRLVAARSDGIGANILALGASQGVADHTLRVAVLKAGHRRRQGRVLSAVHFRIVHRRHRRRSARDH